MDPYDTVCLRCGYAWECGQFVRSDLRFFLGYFDGLQRIRRFFRVVTVGVPCDHCRKPMRIRALKGAWTCSKECDDNWMPF